MADELHEGMGESWFTPDEEAERRRRDDLVAELNRWIVVRLEEWFTLPSHELKGP